MSGTKSKSNAKGTLEKPGTRKGMKTEPKPKGTTKGKGTKATPVATAPAKERHFGMTPAEAKALRLETPKGKIPNPYREASTYGMLFSVFASHLGKPVTSKQLVAEVQKLGDKDFWKAFKAKAARNEETALDWTGRLIQSGKVLCRQKDYGKPIVDIGLHLSQETEGGETTFKLTKAK